ncbi:MAG: hypothetical protein LQ338_000795 [Usnochroma carphineum]|nr:MAG: hypothetical protein LQ338_000795 [Usnochroma carphineum]
MDPLKLLSRSTNLQKSSGSKAVNVRIFPSAADSDRLDKNTSAHGDLAEGIKRGKKRKRSAESDGLDLQTRQFLRVNGSPSKLAEPSRVDNADQSLNSTGCGIEKPPETGKDNTTFDREGWRKALKQNRVKVTLLRSGLQVANEGKRRHKRLSGQDVHASDRTQKAHVQLTSRPLQLFSQIITEYNVSKRLALNLAAQGYSIPTEVQLGSIPILLGQDFDRGLQLDDKKEHEGHCRSAVDLMTIAPTGSGKTLAFLVHLLHGLQQNRRQRKTKLDINIGNGLPQALILAPTHELVDQIVNEGKKLALGTGIKVSRMRKGMKIGSDGLIGEEPGTEDMPQVANNGLSDHQPSESSIIKADILVSTPMLLLRAIAPFQEPTTTTSLADVRYLVLDEADVLLDPLFRTQTLEIWNLCTNADLQASLWSATIGSSIEDLARNFILDRRRRLGLDTGKAKHHTIRLIVGLKDSAVPNISHRLVYAATEQGKLMALRHMIHPTAAMVSNGPPLQPPFLVFTQTIPRAVALYSELLYEIPPEAGGSSRIAVLHSDISDKSRSAIMAGFRKGDVWILITTDLLARGVDFRGVNGVVNYDIPNSSGVYVHRVGRTGRQGREGGVAVTLYTKEDIKYVKNVANVIAASEKQRIKVPGAKEETGLQEWLLNALPDVSKKAKKDLKKHGVEARRTSIKSKNGSREARRMRISTKSGYDRTLEQKKRQVQAGPQHESMKEDTDVEWDGIKD